MKTKLLAFICDWCGRKSYGEGDSVRCLACVSTREAELCAQQGRHRCGSGTWVNMPKKSAS